MKGVSLLVSQGGWILGVYLGGQVLDSSFQQRYFLELNFIGGDEFSYLSTERGDILVHRGKTSSYRNLLLGENMFPIVARAAVRGFRRR